MIEVDEVRFASYRSAIDAADVAVASFKDGTGSDQVVIVKGRRLVEAVACGRNAFESKPVLRSLPIQAGGRSFAMCHGMVGRTHRPNRQRLRADVRTSERRPPCRFPADHRDLAGLLPRGTPGRRTDGVSRSTSSPTSTRTSRA